MIKYKLTCKKCDNSFDSWFPSSKEYEKLKRLKHINCYNCNSLEVEKSLMTPNVLNYKSEKIEKIKNRKFANVKRIIKKYQKFIKNNFKYVGENFTYEARSMHYKNKKKSKEGIETEIIPWINEKEN